MVIRVANIASQVVPKENQKKLEVDLKLFLDSVDRVASVSLDKKDGVKFNLSKDIFGITEVKPEVDLLANAIKECIELDKKRGVEPNLD